MEMTLGSIPWQLLRNFRNILWLLLRKRSGASRGRGDGRIGERQVGISILHSGAPSPLAVATGDRFKFGVVMTTSSARMEENELTPGPFPPPPVFSHDPLSLPTPPSRSHWLARSAVVRPGRHGDGGRP